MENLSSLPFKVGHQVESRSFLGGYRGAWFRSKIKEFGRRGVALDYYDFSDEKVAWMKIYQKIPWKTKSGKMELMLRPQFPPVYSEGEAPDVKTLSEAIVVTTGVWKVGDLVDWFCDGVYWSGKITEVREDDKVEIELPPRPSGEGLSYEAFCKDLRPSLEWSPRRGWKVPTPRGRNRSKCARLVHPINQGELENEGKKDVEIADDNACTSRSLSHSLPSLDGSQSKGKRSENQTAAGLREQSQEVKRDVDAGEPSLGKGSCSDSVASSHVRASAEVAGESSCKERASENESSKKIRLSERISLNSTNCDSIESVIIDLEELLNRVKWIKGILEPSEPEKPTWKFMEYRAGENQTGPD